MMLIKIEIININLIYKLNKNLYFILGIDLYIIEYIKNKIINFSKKLGFFYLENIYIYSNIDLLNFINFNLNYDIFFDKKILVINLFKLDDYLLLIKYKNNIFINKKNIIFIFIKNKFKSLYEKKIILNILNKFNFIFFKIDNLNYNNFIFFLNKKINYANCYDLNKKMYNFLYLIYKDNFFSILSIINYLIENKSITNNNKKLEYFIIDNPNLYINYESWVILSLLGYKKLSDSILLIIKNQNNINNIIISILIFLYKCIFILIFILDNNIYKNIYYYLDTYNINYKYYNVLLNSSKRLNKIILYKVLKIICLIEIEIKKYEYFDENIIWSKFDLISLLLEKKK